MPDVIIDTNILEYAFVIPSKEEFLEIHEKCRKLVLELLEDESVRILVSTYQAAEVLDVLRKVGADEELRQQVFDMFALDRFLRRPVSWENLQCAFEQSLRSGIHIYDYLVVIPFAGDVDRIYSADQHFDHRDFRDVAPVINPTEEWILTEGRRPERITSQMGESIR